MAQLSRIRRYEPKVGNADRPSNEAPIVAYLRSVDVYTKQVQIRKFLTMSADQLMAELMDDKGSKVIKEMLLKNVVRFENLEITEPVSGDGGEEVTRPATMQDLWDMGEFQLCLELFTELLQSTQLRQEEAKNSASPSGSTPASDAEAR